MTSPSAPSTSGSSGSTGPSGLAAVLLQQSDVPVGYQAEDEEAADPDDDASSDFLYRCLGMAPISGQRTDREPPTIYASTAVGIHSSAARLRTQAAADTTTKLFDNPKSKSCFTALLTRKLAKDGRPDPHSATVRVFSGPGGGPANLAGRVTSEFVFTKYGSTIHVFLDLSYLTGPKLEAQVYFSGFDERPDPAVEKHVVDAVAKRAARA